MHRGHSPVPAHRRRPPVSTYRLQLRPGFGFADAAGIAPYLAALGVTHVYLSPILQAAPGSEHGYDVVDHSRISADLGGDAAFRAMVERFHHHGLGVVADIVPNHMAIPVPEFLNRQLWSVLREGRSSPFAHWFDVDWQAQGGKLLLPILAGPAEDCLGDITVERSPVLTSAELPAPGQAGHGHGALGQAGGGRVAPGQGTPDQAGSGQAALSQSSSGQPIAGEARPGQPSRGQPPPGQPAPGQGAAGEPVLRYLGHLLPLRAGTADLPLRDLLQEQHYRLADWRAAATELNWRRFFDITSLIAIRVEDAGVFAATHQLLLSLVADGLIDGLRVDHPDGLADPRGYLARLAEATGGAWVVAEKILARTEELPPDWQCAGTTGYDTLGQLTGLFLDPAGEGRLTDTYAALTGGSRRFAEVAEDAKRQTADRAFAAEVSRLTRLLARVGEPAVAAAGAAGLRAVIAELIAAFRVYRAYVVPGEPAPRESAAIVEAAAASARRHLPARLHAALAAVRDLVLARDGLARGVLPGDVLGRGVFPEDQPARAALPEDRPARAALPGDRPARGALPGDRLAREIHPEDQLAREVDPGGGLTDSGLAGGDRPDTSELRDEFTVRFQQTSGPVMAKGVEDTAFYRWSRLAALNEVGGDPDRFGVSPDDFHAFAGRLARDWPATMSTLSTHDTKRQEDVRARLLALAESPRIWARRVTGWHGRAARLTGGRLPEPDTEYLLWQTLVGTWPTGTGRPPATDRITAYLRKAMREAKTRTSWTDPDPGYESAVLTFAEAVLHDPELAADIAGFVARIAPDARVNSLGAKLIQLTMPGVADVYQGCELTGLSLVDPDNRRPVDFARRARMLAALDAPAPGAEPAALPPRGGLDAEKLLVTSRALRLRRAHSDWFASSYQPLAAAGTAAHHVVAFARGGLAVAVATRLPGALRRTGGWGQTVLPLPEGRWRDVLTGAIHAGPAPLLSQLTQRLPVALLVPDGEPAERAGHSAKGVAGEGRA